MTKKQDFDALMDWLLPGYVMMTEEQVRQALQSEWIGTLTQLWDAIGKVVDKKQLAVYVKELADIPLGGLEQVVSRLLAKHKFHTVPTVGDIWWETAEVIGYGAFHSPMHGEKTLDMETLKRRLAEWSPTPRVDKYAEVEA